MEDYLWQRKPGFKFYFSFSVTHEKTERFNIAIVIMTQKMLLLSMQWLCYNYTFLLCL